MKQIQQACDNMIRQQLRTVGVLNNEILAVIRNTPREAFVPEAYHGFAYADMTIPLAHGQEMLMPQDEAQMLQALALQESDSILEVGTGSGYFTALLAQLGADVTSVDIFQDFIDAAQANEFLKQYRNIQYQCADFAKGPLGEACYDAIVITGALETLPEAYFEALKPKGRLVVILGDQPAMHAKCFIKGEPGISEILLFETVTPYLINAARKDSFKF